MEESWRVICSNKRGEIRDYNKVVIAYIIFKNINKNLNGIYWMDICKVSMIWILFYSENAIKVNKMLTIINSIKNLLYT